jgi:hypothetical protein
MSHKPGHGGRGEASEMGPPCDGTAVRLGKERITPGYFLGLTKKALKIAFTVTQIPSIYIQWFLLAETKQGPNSSFVLPAMHLKPCTGKEFISPLPPHPTSNGWVFLPG